MKAMTRIIKRLLRIGMTAMSRITCKDCGKVWSDQAAFDDDKGCDRGWCINTEESIMARRKKNKPAFIPAVAALAVGATTDGGVEQVVLQVHQTSGPVLSLWDPAESLVELVIPNVININIFPRKGVAR